MICITLMADVLFSTQGSTCGPFPVIDQSLAHIPNYINGGDAHVIPSFTAEAYVPSSLRMLCACFNDDLSESFLKLDNVWQFFASAAVIHMWLMISIFIEYGYYHRNEINSPLCRQTVLSQFLQQRTTAPPKLPVLSIWLHHVDNKTTAADNHLRLIYHVEIR